MHYLLVQVNVPRGLKEWGPALELEHYFWFGAYPSHWGYFALIVRHSKLGEV